MFLPAESELEQLDRQGFFITGPLLSEPELGDLTRALEKQKLETDGRKRGGIRDVIDNLPIVRDLAAHPSVRAIVDQVLGVDAFVVRATLFDKTELSNWKVPWHQDVTIAVQKRHEVPGYGPWSVKSGVTHVQPPSEVLEQMVTLRVHLDDCPASNGALRVMPGTHRLGRIDQNHAAAHVDESRAVCCEVMHGQALVMRPLLLHASSQSQRPGHRRVLHFDFAIQQLPGSLNWRIPNPT